MANRLTTCSRIRRCQPTECVEVLPSVRARAAGATYGHGPSVASLFEPCVKLSTTAWRLHNIAPCRGAHPAHASPLSLRERGAGGEGAPPRILPLRRHARRKQYENVGGAQPLIVANSRTPSALCIHSPAARRGCAFSQRRGGPRCCLTYRDGCPLPENEGDVALLCYHISGVSP